MTEVQPRRVDVSPDKLSAWVHFSGMAYSDYGRTETLNHWPMSRVFEATRYFGLVRGMLEFTSLVNRHTGYFVLGGLYHFDEALWRIPRQQDIPFKVSLEVQDIGNTSVTLFSRMVNKLDNKVLATASIKLVFVNRASRRPIPLPEWMRQTYELAIKERKPFSLPSKPPEIPQSAYQFPVRVTASDTDVNRHTNQASYVRFCCDAAQAAVVDGRLSTFAPDIARHPLQMMQAVYVGESDFGDSLTVFVWQQEGQPEILNFVIRRDSDKKSVPIFHSVMKYGLAAVKPLRPSKL